MQREDEREEVDVVEEAVSSETEAAEEESEADAAEQQAEREADEYEERDHQTGDDPPPA